MSEPAVTLDMWGGGHFFTKGISMGLTITRRIEQTVCIGEATVKITKLSPSSVKLCITAPSDLPIRRGELEPRTDGGPEADASPGTDAAKDGDTADGGSE